MVVIDSVFVSVLPGGAALVSVVVVVFDFLSWLAGGFTIVVFVSVFLSAGAGTTSVFCSHAPRSAALARMQNNFFIVGLVARLGIKPESEQAKFPALLAQIFRRSSAFRGLA